MQLSCLWKIYFQIWT